MAGTLDKIPLDTDQTASPLKSQKTLKIKGMMKANVKLFDVSPKKIKQDPESYEFWYSEAKKYLRQVLITLYSHHY